jgi:DNA helicase-2/ATP-dependent DNA helicase PcrA
MHRVAMSGNDAAGRLALESLGLSVRAAKPGGWRYETATKSYEHVTATVERIRTALDAEVVFTARLGRNGGEALGSNSLPFLPAAAVHPGMVMFDEDGGYDVVERVERVRLDRPVHDIDVEWTHNFVAAGIVTHNSIYGWRGADVRNILSFQRDHPNANVVTLDQNYRSTQVILDAAHAVIRHNTERAAKRLWTERMGGEKVRVISVYDEQEEAVAITSEIEALVRSEDFSYSDCAVLYRTNAQSRALEDVLLRRGIPYRLVGGPRFYERREIKDVLAYLRLVANPRDAVSFARIVNVPRRKIGDRTVQELEQLARRHRISPFEAVQHLDEVDSLGGAAIAALESFRTLIEGLRVDAARLPLPELVDRILLETGYRSMLQDGTPEGEERWNNVTELVGLAGEYADAAPPEGLQAFLENVALVSDVDSLDAGGEGVTLITLHQVKGLEFPVVFMAGMEEGLMPHLRAMEEGDAGLAEERRLAYVGITRAQKRLYLLHAFRRHLYGTPQLAEASRFLRDLPAEVIEIPQRPGGPPPGDPRAPGAVHRAVHAHAVRPNPVEVAPQRYQQGMRVRHRKYGDGIVLKSIMTRSGEEVTIKFDDAGLKIFAVADAGPALSPAP